MKEDGYRLYVSLDKNDFTVTDMITGDSIVRKDGNYIADTLSKDIVLQHIQNLQEAMLSSKVTTTLMQPVKCADDDKVLIKEEGHHIWTLCYKGKSAIIKDHFKCQVGFDRGTIIQKINKLYYEMMTKGVSLNPKRDIVRRIADVGVLVWVHDGHSVVCYEKNIQGITMQNCLIDGKYYDTVVVSTSEETNTVCMFDKNLERLILEWPLDKSVLVYYPDISKELEKI